MKNLIKVSIILLTIDLIYLKLIGGKPFVDMVNQIQNKAVVLDKTYAFMSYLLLIVAMHRFIIQKKESNVNAFILGSLIYGVFDFTNAALFTNYNIMVGIQDTIWGGMLFMITNIIFNKLQ